MMSPEERTPAPVPPPLNTNAVAAVRGWFGKRALVFKIIAILFFAMLLLFPLSLVKDTLSERQRNYASAVDSITTPWGGSQQIIGPVLVVPFTYKVESEEWVVVGTNRFKEKKTREVMSEAFFLPDQLNVNGVLTPSKRTRSIYTAHVYTAALQISGRFDKPDFSFINRPDVQPQWNRARVCFAITDLRGVRESLTLAWGGASGENIPMHPGSQISNEAGLHAMLPEHAAQNGGDFSLSLTLNGSDAFLLAPLARSTKMNLKSPWPDPSFHGDYLPVKRTVSPSGFDAQWEMSFYARALPQQWWSESLTIGDDALSKGAFGVRMLPAISSYRVVERAIKYGILFIALVFTVFFLFEVVAGLRLNSINYLLVGATLCVFFLALLALSEFVAFGAAYAVSAGIAIVMIGLYCARILRGAGRALGVSAMLGGVYAYLYFVLRMEDFALIAGTAALFAVLGAIMYATRNLHGDSGAAEKAHPPTPASS